MTGKVIWFNDSAGYGFIRPDNEDKDYFFHWRDIISEQGYKDISSGSRVSFNPQTRDGKCTCLNVRQIQELNPANNKPLVYVTVLKIKDNMNTTNLIIDLSSYSAKSLKYLNLFTNYAILSSSKLILNYEEYDYIISKMNDTNSILELPKQSYDIKMLKY